MRALVIYYSRTGNTRKAAEELADALGADRAEIRCARYGPGLMGYLTAGLDSLTGRLPEITPPTMHSPDYNLVVVGGPIWTDRPALPIRVFLRSEPKLPPKVGLLLTRDRVPPEPAFAEMQSLLGRPVVGTLALTAGEIRSGAIRDQVQAFAGRLHATAATEPGVVHLGGTLG